MAQSDDPSNHAIRFCWGKKRGIGGAKRNIQFYESFMIDDVNYSLFDCVYLHETDALEPYIGKIVKIWEQPDRKKKLKILWFFRPNELQNYLGDHTLLEKEIFLATGEGVGLFNINPLEAIAGKCSVICTSKDERNRQPSNRELEMADYIFYRTFDVQTYTISEKINDKIAGVEAKYLLNQKDIQPTSVFMFEEKGGSGKAENISISSLMSRLDDKIESAATSTKRDDVIAGELLEGQCPLGEDKEDVLVSANHVEDNLNYGKSKSNVGLNDNKPSEKMRLIDTTIEAPNGTSLRKENFESNDSGSQKKSTNAFIEASSDSSPVKRKFELDRVGSSKEIVHVGKESSEKNYALDGIRFSKNMKPTDAPEFLNDASSRKQNVESNGPSYFRETIHLTNSAPEKRSLIEKKTKPLDESSQETSSISIGNKEKTNYGVLEVTKRPDADRSKWFKGLPWEERMQKADEQGTLVFIENLDPLFTSSEVEDIIYHTLKQSCTARVIQQTMFQNPNYGQAYVIFKTRDAADSAVSKINKGCIQLPNGSPLICSKGMLKVPKSSMFGHLSVDKNKLQMREMRRAVSTSHCSQPNTIEYEMAMDWLVIQERSVRCLNALHKGQADELKAIKKRLRTK
ncbi:protein ANTI-SILENCING 1-like [Musa acuminata AAA Group]|uniref:protein ANTI-SILENCING 1-like n=1 Tax=Musa acuminata AAA Group TaxID=214697 RepID=UPI0031E2F104